MKHCSTGSMTEATMECSLQKLCIDLCNLIVESRIPGANERGYGDGIHCPPLIGANTHKCDSTQIQCQKHQRLIQHLMQAIDRGIFEIDVLMLPNCCAESILSEKIQCQEYLLLERWTMKCSRNDYHPHLEVPQLLRAVRSFLHFSQISAWLSSTKGKTLGNFYYWVKPNIDSLGAKFEQDPEMHTFPACKLSDELSGNVQVRYSPRTQYVPIIPCSKHPPIPNYVFRPVNEDSNLCRNIPLNPQIIRQLHNACDAYSTPLIAKSFVPETATLLLTPAFKTFTDGITPSRILTHSNCQSSLLHAPITNSENIPHSQTSYMCKTLKNCSIQKNMCFRERQLVMKVKRLKKDVPVPLGFQITSEIPTKSRSYKRNIMFSIDSKTTPKTSEMDISSINAAFLNSNSSPFINVQSNSYAKQMQYHSSNQKSKKRTVANTDEKDIIIPFKRSRCDTECSPQFLNCLSDISETPLIPCASPLSSTTGNLEASVIDNHLITHSSLLDNAPTTETSFKVSKLASHVLLQQRRLKRRGVRHTNSSNCGNIQNKQKDGLNLQSSSKSRRARPSQTATIDATESIKPSENSIKKVKVFYEHDATSDIEGSTNKLLLLTSINSSTSLKKTETVPPVNSQLSSEPRVSKQVFLPPLKPSSFKLNGLPNSYRASAINPNLECFPKHIKFSKGRKLLANFEESILRGCLPTISSVKGFRAEIGASGSFCPNHLTLPADVSFYELGDPYQNSTPYVAQVSLRKTEYYLPRKGVVQITLFNPSETVVKMFVLNYDLSTMPPMCHTFMRQKTYYLPVGATEEQPRWLRFIIHLRFASSRSGRIFLHEDFKIVVLNKCNDDAASEFNQEPRELRSFLSVPMNPTFSNL